MTRGFEAPGSNPGAPPQKVVANADNPAGNLEVLSSGVERLARLPRP
jgi:hypothetical protein